ncbi:hypothetical protein [Actinomadura chibensis]|uniref:hypothetical protein n=1 Tax=Actinomadura chibensis TaxID=392828 RepID=UPI000836EC98|nr:hypothetical protein [Actinomadura chibensis]
MLLLLPTGVSGGVGWYVASTAVAGVGYGISFAVVAAALHAALGAVTVRRVPRPAADAPRTGPSWTS